VPTLGGHQAKQVFESEQAIIFDDFLPDELYQRLHRFALDMEYEAAGHGKMSQARHLHDGFPLRSQMNLRYYTDQSRKHNAEHIYPTQTEMDGFMDHLLALQPHVERLTGKRDKDWLHASARAWIYPHGTGLSPNGANAAATGNYMYFLNPNWRTHWGGMLLIADEEGKRMVRDQQRNGNGDGRAGNARPGPAAEDLLMESGFARCILPKRNRIVFIANGAYHMITRVNEASGDNIRVSLAGAFNRNP